MPRNKRWETLTFCLGIVLIGCLLQTAGWLKNDRLVFPDVAEILRAFLRLLGTAETYRKIRVTLWHLIQVMAASTVIGVAVGMAEGFSDFVRALLRPLMITLRAIPMVVLVVIVMVLTKYERVPLIAPSLFLIPLISEATSEGCRRIEPEMIDAYRLDSAFNGYVFARVYLPLMAGYLRQAYVSAAGMGLKMVVSSEYLVQTRDSLGKAVNSSSYFNEYQDIYAYALIMILLVLLISELPALLGWLLRRCRPAESAA
ncbi:MAG: ABC transporter permease subunit [Oscillospiraceae bacterium]|nr:ABC transporter permease subunit [Oscillospiraceae bacterium]